MGLAAGSSRAQELFERSGGHPLFLQELARAGEGELPASIRAAVTQRCDSAGAGVAATLRAVAILGPDVDLDLLAAVLDEPVAVLLDHLEESREYAAQLPAVRAYRHRYGVSDDR